MLKRVRADLHIHTSLSPCADLEMTPVRVLKRAKEVGIDMIAICDHNSAKNTIYTFKAGQNFPVKVFSGIEVNCAEEVHILSIFDRPESALLFQEHIYKGIKEKNNEELFGVQAVVDENDEVVEIEKRLLIGACELKIKEVLDIVHSLGGLVIASHVDREAFSITGKLGFIPEDLNLDAVEVSKTCKSFSIKGFPVVSFSDAHRLDEIGEVWTTFEVERMDVEGLKEAFINNRIKING